MKYIHKTLSMSISLIMLLMLITACTPSPTNDPSSTTSAAASASFSDQTSLPVYTDSDVSSLLSSDTSSENPDFPGSTGVSAGPSSASVGGQLSSASSSAVSGGADVPLKSIGDVYVNVKDFGAKADGVNDDSGAIEAAITSINKTGGTVYLPSGRYRMAKGILVPIGISVIGDTPTTKAKWHSISATSSAKAAETGGSSWMASSNFSGTWILVDHGKGNVDSAPTFRIQGNTTIENLGFVYPGQAPAATSVSEYPPAVGIITSVANRFVRDGMRIAGLNLLNPYVGIAIMQNQDIHNYYVGASDTQDGKISTGRITVSDITGSPLLKGIYIKGILDTVDIQRVRFGYSNFHNQFATYRHNNAVDFEVARADGINIYDSVSLGASYGIKTTTAFSGSSSIRASKLTIRSRVPVSVVTGMYIFSESDLYMSNYGGFCSSDNYTGIEVFQDPQCVHQPMYLFSKIKLTNEIRSSSKTDIGMHIKMGKSGNISVYDSVFNNASPDTTDPVILFERNDGSAISAHFLDCEFTNASGSGLLARNVTIPNGALQFKACVIADSLYSSMPGNSNIWFIGSKLKSGGGLNIR